MKRVSPEPAIRHQRAAQFAVGRDLMPDLLRTKGATVTVLGRSAEFILVDTEAAPETGGMGGAGQTL